MERVDTMRWRSAIATVGGGARDFLCAAIFVYGFVHASYKLGNPSFGGDDFYKYKDMVGHPFDFSAAPAPFVLRQITTVVASLFYELGFHYNSAATVDSLGFDQDTKRRFFSLILSNALAVCLTIAILSTYLRTKLAKYGIAELFGLFGIFAAWFYFSNHVMAPLTVGWGWVSSSLLAIAFLEQNAAMTCVACVIALFSRETTLIFALMMFVALILFEGNRRWSIMASAAVLAAGCLAYLILRLLFTTGYQHQIDPHSVLRSFLSPKLWLSRYFLFQSILSQGLLALLLFLIAMKQPRYAGYLLLAAAAVAFVALGAAVDQIALLLGETLPFYAVIFLLCWHTRDSPSQRAH
jgi:hypothetical protein